MKKLKGIVAAMVTPFEVRGSIDSQAVREQTAFLISRGLENVLVCGTTGEAPLLSLSERRAMTNTVLDAAGGRLTIFVQAEAGTVEDSIALACDAIDHGADGIALLTPTYFRYSDLELVTYLSEIAQKLPADAPVYLYSIPQYATNDLSPACVRAIAEKCKNVVGIKYSGGDMALVDNYLRTVPGIDVMMGTDQMILPGLAMGCKGAVSGPSSAFPEPYLALYDAFTRGDMEKARYWQGVANGFNDTLANMDSISRFKATLTLRGVSGGYARAPRLALTDAQVGELCSAMSGLDNVIKWNCEE